MTLIIITPRLMKKGFTLIELLIVITIIGILAVVFLPSILSAPAKARDAARIADVATITESIEAYRLENKIIIDQWCIQDALSLDDNPGIVNYFPGGKFPTDPNNTGPGESGHCADDYSLTFVGSAVGSPYRYLVFARVEIESNGNIACEDITGEDAAPTSLGDSGDCYGVYSR
jgi:prepilin-type N-terminal cleavage/methylation domain-containing protein